MYLYKQLLGAILPVLVTLIGTALVGAIPLLFAWLRTKTQSAAVQAVLGRIGDHAVGVVRAIQQTIVDDVKAAGGWNKDVGARVKDEAMARLKAALGTAGIKAAGDALQIGGIALESLLADKLEAALHAVKASAPAQPTASSPRPPSP